MGAEDRSLDFFGTVVDNEVDESEILGVSMCTYARKEEPKVKRT